MHLALSSVSFFSRLACGLAYAAVEAPIHYAAKDEEDEQYDDNDHENGVDLE